MTQTILGKSKKDFIKKIKIRKWICAVIALCAVLLNIYLTSIRNDDNHTLLLFLNIIVDVVFGWGLVIFVSFAITPQSRLYKIYNEPHEGYIGVISAISTEVERVGFFDCVRVTIGERNPRIFFLPIDTIRLQVGAKYQFETYANIIVEVTACENE